MVSIALGFVCLLTALVLGYLLVWSYRRNSRLRTAIIGTTLLHETVVVIFPVFYSIFTDYYLETAIFSSPKDLLTVMIGELLFVVMFAIGVRWNVSGKKIYESTQCLNKSIKAKQHQMVAREKDTNLLFMILVSMSLGFLLIDYSSIILRGAEYFATIDDSIRSESILMRIIAISKHLFSFPAFVAAALIIVKLPFEKNCSRYSILVAWALLAIVVMMSLSIGVRGRLAWIFSCLFIFGYLNNNKRAIIIGFIIFTITISSFSFLGEIRGTVLSSAIRQNVSRTELLNLAWQETRDRGQSSEGFWGDTIEKGAIRGQATRNSTILYELFDEGRGLGLTHYVASLFPIPKFIWPNKPLAGSYDGTLYGRANYVVMRIAYGTFYNMGPILASAHAYWEGGWVWLLAVGLIIGLFWNYYIRWCDDLGGQLGYFFGILPTGALIVDGFLTSLMPLHSIIHYFWLSVVTTYLIYKIVHLLRPIMGIMRQFRVNRL